METILLTGETDNFYRNLKDELLKIYDVHGCELTINMVRR